MSQQQGRGAKSNGRTIQPGGIRQEKSLLSIGSFDLSKKMNILVEKYDFEVVLKYDPDGGRITLRIKRNYYKELSPDEVKKNKVADLDYSKSSDNTAVDNSGVIYQMREKEGEIPAGSSASAMPAKKMKEKVYYMLMEHIFTTNKEFYDYVEKLEKAAAKDEAKAEIGKNKYTAVSERLARKIKIEGQIVNLRDKLSSNLITELYDRIEKLDQEEILSEELSLIITKLHSMAKGANDHYYLDAIAVSNNTFKGQYSAYEPKQGSSTNDSSSQSSSSSSI